MKRNGYILISLSFLVGSYLTSLDPQLVNWAWFVPALIAGFVGVALVRAGTRQESHHEDKLASNISIIDESIERIVQKVSHLNAEKATIHTYDMGPRIDELMIEDLNAFIEARQTIGHVYGLQAYAEVMNHYAAGERYLNRVWSASADGYIDEVNMYIAKAETQFVEAKTRLAALKS